MHLAFLYEDAAQYHKGLEIVKKMVAIYPRDKDANLYYALLSYRCRKIEQAHLAFRKALNYMSIEEKQDFVVNSVNVLLERFWKDQEYSEQQIQRVKNRYWQMNDPLLLTEYNERLVEHYARVAYANLRFSVPEMGIIGWKSDRGKIFIKYGEPDNRTRLRPQIDETGILYVKTDIWNYGDFTLGFSDDYASGNFRFSEPGNGGSKSKSQFNAETQLIVDNLKSSQPDRYEPVFEGPRINIANRLAQFKNPNHFTNEKTDIYVYYAIPAVDTLKVQGAAFSHLAGLFFFDRSNELKYQKRSHIDQNSIQNTISVSDSIRLNVYAERMSAKADSGVIAFEVIRDYDKGVSSHHGKLNIRNFSRYDLDISDMILASKLNFENDNSMTINRNGISFVPNPSLVFKTDGTIYLYCEIYNLAKGADSFTDFEQVITISPLSASENKGIAGFFRNITDWVGITDRGQQVTLRSAYQTDESDVPVYLQLDMSDYVPADYNVKLTIYDNNSGKVISDQSMLFLR
ncbi:MAG: GWxTD domain-containing protein [Calditrichaeota bacterium]|nr:GWxTD domain-containing protein [Calditrichota bacterium]